MTERKQEITSGKCEIAVQEPNNLMEMHVTHDLFCDWQAGRMKQPEEERFLGHIGTCTFCAQRFGDWMEEDIEKPELSMELAKRTEDSGQYKVSLLSEPPAYLKEQILHRSRQMDVQAAIHIKDTSQKVQLFMYSLKVGLAVMASIFLLMVTSNVQNMDFEAVQIQQEQRIEREDPQREPGITDTLKQKSGEISSLLNSLSNGLFRIEKEETKQEEIRR